MFPRGAHFYSVVVTLIWTLDASAETDVTRFFESRVRPLLVDKCQGCHGEKKQEGDLRLDSRAALLRGGSRGAAIVPGDPDRSLLIRAVRRVDNDLSMPPKRVLSQMQVELLVRWVRDGAVWPEDAAITTVRPITRVRSIRDKHWAFRPIRRPRPPTSVNGLESWSENDIDRFILERLQASGLTPSPRADRRTLLRRAHIDLIGLPPTYDEVQAFLEDDSPDAFARVVDGLLERSGYGERWARRWLDVARYSDGKGYIDGGARRYAFAYTYRDYVIDAFNRDLPFDQFVLEQLAADQLDSGGDKRALAALGFLTVGSRFNHFPHEIIDDRIDVVSRGFLALTVSCARCHDHKYDPIGTDDYYGLYGVFASSREPTPDRYPLLTAPGPAEDEEFQKKLREAAEKYHKRRADLYEQITLELRGWVGDYLRYIVQTTPEHRTQAQPPVRTERGTIRVFSAYARGGVGRWRRYLAACGPDDPVFGLWNRLVALSRDELPGAFPRVLAELEASGMASVLVLKVFAEKPPATMADVADVYGDLLEEVDTLWRRRIEADPNAAALEDGDREVLRQSLYGPAAPGSFSLDESEDIYTLGESVEVRSLYSEIEKLFLEAKGKVGARAMVMEDRPRPVEPRVFLRGDPERHGKRVARQLPALLRTLQPEPFAIGSGRLELARAIVDRSNPLTARVIVNRVWGWHFGRGLVATPSDFGVRSEEPTHPELLDYLAAWLMDNGWSLKKLHRLILSSSVWQQASVDRPECRRQDPGNTLVWRMNRQRLDFEAMRDSMLATSGILESFNGGTPVEKKPDDPSNTVRTLYTAVDRENLAGVFRVFDFPSPDISSPGRPRTTVPQQALFLLNSRFVIRQSDALAARTDIDSGSVELVDRVRRLYEIVYARDPEPEEIKLAAGFITRRSAEENETGESVAAPSAWQYGFGAYEAREQRLASFTPLPHFSGTAWQGGPEYPDGNLRYLQLTSTGGRVGIDAAHAAVRRWVAPRDGVVVISGTLSHGRETCGDGVNAWIVSSSSREVGSWNVYKGQVETSVSSVPVTTGDVIDFVVDRRENHTCDVFDWAPTIRYEGAERVWSAEKDFGGGEQSKPNPWSELAQALLQSNEFLFVD